MAHRATKVFFDGGCRPNPGAMETAVVARGVAHVETDLGDGGSMEAEWLALLHALRVAHALDLRDVVLLGDALAVIGQATNARRCPDAACRGHHATAQALIAQFDRVRIRYLKRAQNLAGIALAATHGRL